MAIKKSPQKWKCPPFCFSPQTPLSSDHRRCDRMLKMTTMMMIVMVKKKMMMIMMMLKIDEVWKCFENMQRFNSRRCEDKWSSLIRSKYFQKWNLQTGDGIVTNIPTNICTVEVDSAELDIGILMKYSFGSFWGKYVLCRQFLEIVTDFGFKVLALSETVTGSNTLADQGGTDQNST